MRAWEDACFRLNKLLFCLTWREDVDSVGLLLSQWILDWCKFIFANYIACFLPFYKRRQKRIKKQI